MPIQPDGTTTPPRHASISDPKRFFGWVPSRPDFRDRKFMPPMSIVGLPTKISLRSKEFPRPFNPAWNQGEIGSCGPHTVLKDLVFAGLKTEQRADFPMPSRLFTYYATRSIMGTVGQDSGVDNRSLMKSLAKHGWCDETLWPYTNITANFKKRPPDAAIAQAKTRLIAEYLNVVQNLQVMKACIAANDGFVFGFSVYNSMMTDDVARTGMIPLPRPSDRMEGGHDVWICGYDDDTQMFELGNSWGPNWGVDGFGYIPYAYATNPDMANDFWTVRKTGLPIVIPPPVDPIDPVDPSADYPVEVAVKYKSGKVWQGLVAQRQLPVAEELPMAEPIVDEEPADAPLD